MRASGELMKHVISKLWICCSLLLIIVSFQNCGKLQPGLAIEDQLLSSGLPEINTDELPPGTTIPIDIGEAPQAPGPAPAPGRSDPDMSQEDHEHEQVADHEDEDDDSKNTSETEDEAEDAKVCRSGKHDKGHKVVTLDSTNSSYDGAKDSAKGTTYIFAKAGTSVAEIKNTQGKTVICGCTVGKILNNVGSLVMINSYSDKLDGKRGNVRLINSTINSVLNMKGVIKK